MAHMKLAAIPPFYNFHTTSRIRKAWRSKPLNNKLISKGFAYIHNWTSLPASSAFGFAFHCLGDSNQDQECRAMCPIENWWPVAPARIAES
jgi:hypothetical protein